MAPLRPTNFRLDEDILEALYAIRQRDGISITEQVRRALRVWIKSKRIAVKPVRTRSRALARQAVR